MLDVVLSSFVAGTYTGELCDNSFVPPSQIAMQGDGDIRLVLTVLNGATGLPVDISAATGLNIRLKRPDLTTVDYPASLATNGMDGRLLVLLSPADLLQAGFYFAQASFSISAVPKSTTPEKFRVIESLPAPEEP